MVTSEDNFCDNEISRTLLACDELTFDGCLAKIATQILLPTRRQTSVQHFAEARQKLLRKKVGDIMYKEIMNLVKEIYSRNTGK
mmetsp:Transcript_34172/g.50173  ORF Transcript_34172/g.50173 Transcript_34172/m.50173 type:complete len:84 (+) Transcript_34172:74-325(+)